MPNDNIIPQLFPRNFLLAQNSDPNTLPQGDDDITPLAPEEIAPPGATGSGGSYVNNAINGLLGFFGSGGVNLIRNPSIPNLIAPLIGGGAGLANSSSAASNPSNYQNLLSAALSATGKGSPMTQAVAPAAVGGAADLAIKGKEADINDVILNVLSPAIAAGGQKVKAHAAERTGETGILGAEKVYDNYQNRIRDMSKPGPGDDVLRQSLQPPTPQVATQTKKIPIFDTKTVLPVWYTPEQQKEHFKLVNKYQKELDKLSELPSLTVEQKQRQKLLKDSIQTANDNFGRKVQVPRTNESGEQVYKTSKIKVTTTPKETPITPGTVRADLQKYKDYEDPSLEIANEYLSNYHKAVAAKDLPKQELYSKKINEFATEYPNSTGLRRALARHMLTQDNSQVLNNPLTSVWGGSGGRKLEPQKMRDFQTRISKLDDRASAAIFGSVEKANEFKEFVSKVPDALQRGLEKIRVDVGTTGGATGARFGIESIGKLLNPDAIVNTWFNSEYGKNPEARKGIMLIRALASDNPAVIKALSQPGAKTNMLRTLYDAFNQDNKKKEPEQKQTPAKPKENNGSNKSPTV